MQQEEFRSPPSRRDSRAIPRTEGARDVHGHPPVGGRAIDALSRSIGPRFLSIADQSRAIDDKDQPIAALVQAIDDQFLAIGDECQTFDDEDRAIDDQFQAFDDEDRAIDDQFQAFDDEDQAFDSEFVSIDDGFRLIHDEFPLKGCVAQTNGSLFVLKLGVEVSIACGEGSSGARDRSIEAEFTKIADVYLSFAVVDGRRRDAFPA
jgi:hypothetical protein